MIGIKGRIETVTGGGLNLQRLLRVQLRVFSCGVLFKMFLL